MSSRPLAIDFGTSNSAAAVLEAGEVRRIPIEAGSDTLPTAVFFPARGGAMQIGAKAAEALIEGQEGRYMRALKSVLGTSLLHEPRLIGGKRRSVAEIITAFLLELRLRAEAATGERFTKALSGRPVHFHTRDAARDAKALEDLTACYHAAGFENVEFLPEPEAAAIAAHGLGAPGGLGLIVDIGGGTSDFTVYESTPSGAKILASHGIRLGGTDFDHATSMAHAMPELGFGGELKREMGEGRLPVPNAVYVDLATWSKIPFLYAPEVRREAAKMAKLAVQPKRLNRLVEVLEEELGHELAFAVEAGKIAANGNAPGAKIAMGFVESGLAAPISAASLDAALEVYRRDLTEAATETLALAGVAPEAIGSVVLVGGSSLMALVREEAAKLCAKAEIHMSEAFTAVVDGLALATAQS